MRWFLLEASTQKIRFMSQTLRSPRLEAMETPLHTPLRRWVQQFLSLAASIARWRFLSTGALLGLLLACSTPEATVPSPPGQATVLGSQSRHLQLVCQGQGQPTVLLEAGMAGWTTDWAWVQGSLAQHTRVCAYDRAGYGNSDPVPDGQVPTPQDDLQRLLDSEQLRGPLILVGHSMGGLLVADYARRQPARVAGLVLVDAVYRDQDREDHPTVRSGEYARQRQSLTRLTQWAVWLAPTGLLRLSGNSASLVAPRLPEPQRSLALAHAWSRASYTAVRDENAGFDQWLIQARQAPALPHVPAVVLRSTEARDFPPGFESEPMQSLWAWRQAQLARELGVAPQPVAGSGHYPHVDQPDVVVQAVLQVLHQARAGVVQPP